MFTSETATGRPKGVENKDTKKLREVLSKITEDNSQAFGEVMSEIRTTNPPKFIEMYLKLLEYSMPKLRSMEAKVDVDSSTLEKIVVELVTKDGNNNKGN